MIFRASGQVFDGLENCFDIVLKGELLGFSVGTVVEEWAEFHKCDLYKMRKYAWSCDFSEVVFFLKDKLNDRVPFVAVISIDCWNNFFKIGIALYFNDSITALSFQNVTSH